MKTLLFNPIFINPQAYFVFPNINGSLVQETEVSVEPVMFAGTIEVKVIANGDTSLIRYYKNVSNIDLIKFENSWVRISLYNQLGAVVLGEWKLQVTGKQDEFLPDYLKESLVAVYSTYGKSNEDTDRNVLKDLSGNGNDMRLLNFGFAGNSGYGLPGTDFEGWLCTDGVDDMIESVKPVSEMLEGSNEITVVSIIHQIALRGSTTEAYNNYIRPTGAYIRNGISDYGKTGIYGYTCSNVKNASASNTSIINNLLGDKNDYSAESVGDITKSKFYVQGYIDSNGAIKEVSKTAYAGGFIANKVLTTDEINQVIAYYNLDRPGEIIKPSMLYDVRKQGITNANHAEFNDQLIDFVGGHNIQLNNISWKGVSGIGLYKQDFTAWTKYNAAITNINYKSVTIINNKESNATLYRIIKIGESSSDDNSFTIKVKGSIIKLGYQYINNIGKLVSLSISKEGTYTIPISYNSLYTGNTNTWIGFASYLGCNCIIEQISENSDALYLDGISDFGKATGLPVLKDYTLVADRELLSNKGPVLSKAKNIIDGAFIFESNGSTPKAYSFGGVTDIEINNNREISYQSKYIYNGQTINASTQEDFDMMWLAITRDNSSIYSKLALWSLMLFPYSLSKFLLERQLRKYKAGTLYPDMIEFRPVIKSNVPYSSISYSVNPGMYVTEGSTVTITITLSNETDKLVGVSSNAISDISISGDNGIYEITGKVTKSPQKINIVISSYLTMLGNETLINN